MGEQSILSQIPGVVALVKGLGEAEFEPSRGELPLTLSDPESKEKGKEENNPICAIHHKPME
jgi:hypothetical protein